MVGRLQLEAYVHINTDTEFQHSVDQHMQYIQCSNKLFDLLIYLFTYLLSISDNFKLSLTPNLYIYTWAGCILHTALQGWLGQYLVLSRLKY